MDLSPDTSAVLEYLDGAVEGGLRKRDDVGVILELCAASNNADLFNKVTTVGTGLWKVYSTLRRLQPGAEGFKQLEREFANSMNELRELLATAMEHSDDATLKRFDDIYFGMTQGVMRNVVDIAHDLAQIKALQRK